MKDSVFQKRFERKQQNRQVHGQQLTVFYRDMVPDFPISGLVKLMLRRCEGSVSPGLYRQIIGSPVVCHALKVISAVTGAVQVQE